MRESTPPQRPNVAIIWCNLGTPDEPTASAVRRYLAEFLSDPRIVELPRLLWLPILHGWVLRTRPAQSAARYASIWSPEGSPLKIWTEKQAKLLQGWLGHNGYRVVVAHAMRPCFRIHGYFCDQAGIIHAFVHGKGHFLVTGAVAMVEVHRILTDTGRHLDRGRRA